MWVYIGGSLGTGFGVFIVGHVGFEVFCFNQGLVPSRAPRSSIPSLRSKFSP